MALVLNWSKEQMNNRPKHLWSHGRFSRINLGIFILVFVAIGVYLLLRTWAATSPANGLLGTDPNFFPITVWLQTPESNAVNYKNIGVNTFSGLYNGPSTSSLSALQSAGEGVLLGQQSSALSASFTSYRPVMKGWLQQDEPDNAQPDGNGGYGPCVSPSVIVSQYNAFRAADSTRPVILNLGQGVANINYIGRGSACAGRTDMYPQYAQGADILSFDVYPLNDGYPLTYVADGVDNLLNWGGGKPVWAFIEASPQDSGNPTPTAAQLKNEVWLALTHGASGIQYFCHIFTPSFIEAGCLSISSVKTAMQSVDTEIASLAPVLNSPTVVNGVTASSSSRLDKIVKRYNGDTYVFAASPTSSTNNATFTVTGAGSGTVTVIDESRTLSMTNGGFQDTFSNYGVHLYKISGTTSSPKPGDINGDGRVDITDLSILLANWNSTTNPASDLNADGVVNVFDLSIILSKFGS